MQSPPREERVVANEPVECPNCGSGDIAQLSADLYRCEHCQGSFHWINPSKKTVVHQPDVCECGRVMAGICRQCQKPLCKKHVMKWSDWEPEDDMWGADDVGRLAAQKDASFGLMRCLGGEFLCQSEYDLIEHLLKKQALPDDRDDTVLCAKCVDEYAAKYVAVFRVLAGRELREKAAQLPQEPQTRDIGQRQKGTQLLIGGLGKMWRWITSHLS